MMQLFSTKISKTQCNDTGMAMTLILLLVGFFTENSFYYKSAIPVLTRLIRDKQLGMEGIFALGFFGSDARESVPMLIGIMEDTDSTLRNGAIHTLGRIGSGADQASVPLLNIIKAEGNDSLGLAAILSLEWIGTANAIAALVEALTIDNAAIFAVHSLKKLGPRTVPMLIRNPSGTAVD